MDLRVIFSVPSMTAWMAAERISAGRAAGATLASRRASS